MCVSEQATKKKCSSRRKALRVVTRRHARMWWWLASTQQGGRYFAAGWCVLPSVSNAVHPACIYHVPYPPFSAFVYLFEPNTKLPYRIKGRVTPVPYRS